MSTVRTIEDVISRIKSAAQPWSCETEIWDDDQKLDVRVHDTQGRTVVNYRTLVLRELRQEHLLEILVGDLRLRCDQTPSSSP
jgi:hypothetical protein